MNLKKISCWFDSGWGCQNNPPCKHVSASSQADFSLKTPVSEVNGYRLEREKLEVSTVSNFFLC